MNSKINFCGMILISVLIICYFLRDYSITEHYGATQTEASLSDQLLYNSTQYYNRNKNDFLGKRDADDYDPLPPIDPKENCPVASWYGDKVWTSEGIRTSRIDTDKDEIDFEKNLTQFGNYENNKVKETSAFILKNDIIKGLFKCVKPCAGDWQPTNEFRTTFDIVDKEDGFWGINTNDGSLVYNNFEDNTKINTDYSIDLVTVSKNALYIVHNSPYEKKIIMQYCKDNEKPCKKSDSSIKNIEINWGDTVSDDNVQLSNVKIPDIIREIEVNKDDSVMWVIAGFFDSREFKLYRGDIKKTQNDDGESKLMISFLPEEIDYDKPGESVSELSVSDNYVMAKVDGKYYYKNTNDVDNTWMIIENTDKTGLHLVNDNKS